jgi:hypothetical protein
MQDDKVHQNLLRRWAKRLNLTLKKSRGKRWSVNDQGGYMLIDQNNNILCGEKFDKSIDDIERYLEEYEKQLRG